MISSTKDNENEIWVLESLKYKHKQPYTFYLKNLAKTGNSIFTEKGIYMQFLVVGCAKFDI